MTPTIETQSLPNTLRGLMRACDDDGWKLSVASQAAEDERLRSALAALAEERHEMSLDLAELAVATTRTSSILCGRMEAVFERNHLSASELAACRSDAMLLSECARMELGVIESYQEVAQDAYLPPALLSLVQHHLEVLREGREILQELSIQAGPHWFTGTDRVVH